jgi:prepilin-type N-terminal cleavage/methylation domain-containing protein
MSLFFKKQFSFKNRGFTLVEMMVVVSMVVIMSTVALLNFPKYSANQQLQLGAQDVLTTIRETQIYGIAVRGVASGTETVYKSQGIYINPTFLNYLPVSDRPTESYFMSYVDADYIIGSSDLTNLGFNRTDCRTATPPTTPFPEETKGPCFVKKISEPIRAVDFCVSFDGTTERCFNPENSTDANVVPGVKNSITAVDILFQRPEPEPKLFAFNQGGTRIEDSPGNPKEARYIKIYLVAASNNAAIEGAGEKSVQVWDTGQVSVVGEEARSRETSRGK